MVRIRGTIGDWPVDLTVEMDAEDWAQLAAHLPLEAPPGAVRSALQHADDVLARPGGEEFTVFLPGSTAEQAMQVAERICRRVRDADIVHASSPKGRMTVSIGVATRLPGDDEAEDMLKRADDALYRAKAGGRDQAQA